LYGPELEVEHCNETNPISQNSVIESAIQYLELYKVGLVGGVIGRSLKGDEVQEDVHDNLALA
jgi:hypothetical protein